MTEREPIEIGRTRRPMEAELSAAERQLRSDQVMSELEIREQLQAEQETFEQEAKAAKEKGKEVEARVAQLDLRVKALGGAVRTGRETRPVDILFIYDPTRGEVVEKRSDTGAEILARKPTATDWDTINAKLQKPIESTGDPCRAPKDIPGMDLEAVAELAAEVPDGRPLTIQLLGYHLGLREEGPFTADEERVKLVLLAITAEGQKIELSRAESWAFAGGLRQAAAELAKADDDGTPFAAPAGCGARREGGAACRLDPGHEGLHDDGQQEWATPVAGAAAQTIAEDDAEDEDDDAKDPPGIVDQTMTNVRRIWLGKARDQARDDVVAGRKVKGAETLANILDAPPQVTPAELWDAYETVLRTEGATRTEPAPAEQPKRGRGRPKGSGKKSPG